MRISWLVFFLLTHFLLHAQQGTLTGTVTDEKGKALESATAQLISFTDSTHKLTTTTDKSGSFTIYNIPFGYYRLRVSYISL